MLIYVHWTGGFFPDVTALVSTKCWGRAPTKMMVMESGLITLSVGYANRCMHTWGELSTLGCLASPKMHKPLSHPCLLYGETYCMSGLSLFSLVLYSSKPLEVYLLLLYALVIFPSVSVCVIEAECAARSQCLLSPGRHWGSGPPGFSSLSSCMIVEVS